MSLRYLIAGQKHVRILPRIFHNSQQIFNANLSSQQNIQRSYCTPASKGDNVNKSTQILSTLFPQTSPALDGDKKHEEEKKQEEDSKKEQETAWKRTKLGFIGFGVVSVVSIAFTIKELGSPNVDDDGVIIEDEFMALPLVKGYIMRTWSSMTYYQKVIQEPSRKKLLPDPLKPPYYQPKYTLVLELKDVLVHPDWTYKTGWRFKKRPGVDAFLEKLVGEYEIVVYTADQGLTVFPILDALDPKGFIMYRLVRDATHFVDGHHVKNLDNLNRDLRKVIVIDWDPNSTKLHPENTFHVDRWLGNDDDLSLLDLASFLQTVSTADVEDVRDVLRYYHEFDSPLEQFKENQRKLLQQMQEEQIQEQNKPSSPIKKWTPSFLGHK